CVSSGPGSARAPRASSSIATGRKALGPRFGSRPTGSRISARGSVARRGAPPAACGPRGLSTGDDRGLAALRRVDRRSGPPWSDDAGAEEIVAVLERDREISRERLECRSVLGGRAGRNRGGRRRANVEASRLGPAHPDVVGLGDSVRALEIDVEALAVAEDEI